MKPFIVLTTGRTGSTALMDSLAQHNDIGLPIKQIDCIDNEILHPNFVQKYIPFYQRFLNTPIQNEIDLINAFYQSNQKFSYAGFKSMPNRHKQLNALINTQTLQIITLIRRDTASTIASFIVAIDNHTWRRHGEPQIHSFTFNDAYKPRVLDHLNYILQSQKVLTSIPQAIHLEYETLCKKDFENSQLNDFFQRSISLNNPKQATKASHYVNNWDEFETFVQQAINQTT